MNILQTIILGIVQGLTEFLPISSSGHLVIFKNIMNAGSPGIVFEIALHFGTMIAICTVFWKDIYLIIKDVKFSISKLKSEKKLSEILREDQHTNLFFMIIVATIPTAAIALLFEDVFEQLFHTPFLVGCMLIITGTILRFTKNKISTKPNKNRISIISSIIIGTVQGMSITPGISRSGTTIAAATFLGVDKETAARFSFLLSIPAILGAVVTKLDEIRGNNINLLNLIIGTVVATVVGYIALRYLINLIKRGKFYIFSYYCWIVGLLVMIGFALKNI